MARSQKSRIAVTRAASVSKLMGRPVFLFSVCSYISVVSPDGKYLLFNGADREKQGIHQFSVAENKSNPIANGVPALIVKFSRDGKFVLCAVASSGETIIYRQSWQNGQVFGPARAMLKLSFVFPEYYSGNAYDFSRDLSIVIFARPSGQADLYFLSQK